MLGVKSSRAPIKGAFADKLREQIAIVSKERQSDKTKVETKTSKK